MADKIKPLAAFDLETDPFQRGRIPQAFAADFHREDGHQTYWGDNCVKELMKVLLKFDGIAYAHNGGKFDFHYLLQYLPRNRITKFLAIGGRIVQIKFDWGLELRDSYALIPRGLREWSKEDIDYKKLEANVREKHRAEIIRYLKSDTEHLLDMVTEFVGEYGLHLTLASAAFQILHKQFDVKKCHIKEAMDSKFRRYYFAGRVEFYKLGMLKGPLTCVDINSSFPYSMTKDHWSGEKYLTSGRLPAENLAQSFLLLSALSTGAFPFREDDGSVSFPADGKKRLFYVTGWEFIAARDLGLLYNCVLSVVYTPVEVRNYERYINYFYKIKSSAESSGNKGERLFAKLLLNSSYGKFGMDIREFEELALCDWREPPEPDKKGDWMIEKDDPEMGITLYKRPAPKGKNKFNNVCVAASVTGCSRALLLRAKMKCKGVVYCDTDSLIAADTSKLKVGSALGDWKVENVFSEFHIAGKKLYVGKDTTTGKWKTASKGAKLTPEEIIKVAAGEQVTFEFDAPSFSIKGAMKNSASKWARFTKRRINRADKMPSKL